jgi:hypothetical protein
MQVYYKGSQTSLKGGNGRDISVRGEVVQEIEDL